jgi:hypothetical protein
VTFELMSKQDGRHTLSGTEFLGHLTRFPTRPSSLHGSAQALSHEESEKSTILIQCLRIH